MFRPIAVTMPTRVKSNRPIASVAQRFHSVTPSMSRLAAAVCEQDGRPLNAAGNAGDKPNSIGAHQTQFVH